MKVVQSGAPANSREEFHCKGTLNRCPVSDDDSQIPALLVGLRVQTRLINNKQPMRCDAKLAAQLYSLFILIR